MGLVTSVLMGRYSSAVLWKGRNDLTDDSPHATPGVLEH